MEVNILIRKEEVNSLRKIVSNTKTTYLEKITINKIECSTLEEYKWVYLEVNDTTELFELGRRFEREFHELAK